MLPYMLNYIHILQPLVVYLLATSVFVFKKQSAFFSCLPIQFAFLVLQGLWKNVVIFKLPCP